MDDTSGEHTDETEKPTTDEQSADAQTPPFDRHRRTAILVLYLKGFAMGTAAAVPGVSGGTIALIVGIYDRFIRALTLLNPGILGLLGRVHRRSGRKRLVRDAMEMEIPFLVVLFLGVVTAVLTLARVFQYALATIPGPTFAFFAGLIGASAFVLGERSWLFDRGQLVAGVAGFTIAFLVAGASGTGLFPHTLPVVFLAATLAVSGMVLPGLSGSFILLLLGQYEYLTGVLTDATDGIVTLLSGGSPESLAADLAVVATGVAGAVVGFLTTAHVVRRALERRPAVTFAFLVSLMVGALRYPALQIVETTDISPGPLLVVALAALLGAAVVLALDYHTNDLSYGAFASVRE